MNSSNDASYLVYPTIEDMFGMIGTSLATDILWTYLNTPIAIFGFLTNMFALYVLVTDLSDDFNNSFYQYLRVYILNSAQINFFCIFIFIPNSYRIVSAASSYWPQAYFIYLFVPFFNTGYFYGTALDAVMTLDRIICMMPHLKARVKLTAYQLCWLTLFVCVAINFAFYFAFSPMSITMALSPTQNFTIWFIGSSSFGSSRAGTAVTFSIYFIRDGLLLIAVILLNGVSIYFLKDRLRRKFRLLSRIRILPTIQTTLESGTSVDTLPTSQSRSISVRGSNTSKKDQAKVVEQKLSLMVLYLCLLSIVEHVLMISACVYPIISNSAKVFHNLYFFTILSINFKHGANFVFFYFLNKNFKTGVHRKLNLSD